MKKFLALVTSLAMVLAVLTGCGSTSDESTGGDAAGAADMDPSSENVPVIGDDLEDDGPAQGAHFGKPYDNR